MATVGYVRISPVCKNEAELIASLRDCEERIDTVFIERVSHSVTNRPELKKLQESVKAGDTVVVPSLSVLARSTRDLLLITEKLETKKVRLMSLKENIDTATGKGKVFARVLDILRDVENETTLERQREGIAEARTEGKYHGRPSIAFDEDKFREECEKWQRGEQTAVETMKKMDLKPNTFYRNVEKLGIKKNRVDVNEEGEGNDKLYLRRNGKKLSQGARSQL